MQQGHGLAVGAAEQEVSFVSPHSFSESTVIFLGGALASGRGSELRCGNRETGAGHVLPHDATKLSSCFVKLSNVKNETSSLRRQMHNELNFPPNFDGLVLGCIDADFCK